MGCTNCSEITLFRGEDGAAGADGAPGANGADGIDGINGVYGGWSSEWEFDTNTGSNTGVGEFRFNNASLASVTEIFINDINFDSVDFSTFLAAWNNSGTYGLVRISKKDNTNVFWMGVVTGTDGLTDPDEYKMTVAHTISNGVFADRDNCIISFVRTGDKGDTGAAADVDYENVAWVDKTNGDDTTGVVGRLDLPFETYNVALAACTAGDTIWFRAGSHADNIVLTNDINVHGDNGVVIVGNITDNGVRATSRVTGGIYVRQTNPAGNAISITGDSSDVSIDVDTIYSAGTAVYVNPAGSETANVHVRCRKILGITNNYFAALRGDHSDTTIEVTEIIETDTTTGIFSGINLRDFGGRLHLMSPKMVIGNSTNASGGVFIYEESTTEATAYCHIEVNEVISNYDYVSHDGLGTISKQGKGKLILDITRLSCITRAALVAVNAFSEGQVIIEGHLTSSDNVVVRQASAQSIIIRNSTLHRNNGTTVADENEVVVLGNAAGAAAVGGAVTTNIKIEIVNSTIIKTGVADATGALLARGDDASNRIMLRDVVFIGQGALDWVTNGHIVSVDTGTAGNNDFYFNNCRSNITRLSALAITQQEAAGGAAGIVIADTYLETYDFID